MESAPPAMLWNFEEGLGADSSDSVGASSAGSEGDQLPALLPSMGRHSSISRTAGAGISLFDVRGLLEAPIEPPAPVDQAEATRCFMCSGSFREPKVLACFHSFCKPCLTRQYDEGNGAVLASSADSGHGDSLNPIPSPNAPNKIVCQLCGVETQLSPQLGVDGLLSDYGLEAVLRQEKSGSPPASAKLTSKQAPAAGEAKVGCTGCKSCEPASTYCVNCCNHLCANCTQAHRTMHCFEGHKLEDLLAISGSPSVETNSSHKAGATDQVCKCLEHQSQPLLFYCTTCALAICQECMQNEHPSPGHAVEPIGAVAEAQIASMESLYMEAQRKYAELIAAFQAIDESQNRLNESLRNVKASLENAAKCLYHLVGESQRELQNDLQTSFGHRQYQITVAENELQRMTRKMSTTIEFTQRLLKYASPTELMVFKPLLDSRLKGFIGFNTGAKSALLQSICSVEVQPLELTQARQTIFHLFNSMRKAGPGDIPWNASSSQPIGGDIFSTDIGGLQQRQFNPLQDGVINSENCDDGNLFLPEFLPSDMLSGREQPDPFRTTTVAGGGYIAPSAAQMIRANNGGNRHVGLYSPFESLSARPENIPLGLSAPACNGLLSSRLFADGQGNPNNTSGFNPQGPDYVEKWNSALDPSSLGALSLADPETINDLSILAGSTEKIAFNGVNNISAHMHPPPWQHNQQQQQQQQIYPSRSQVKRMKMTYHCKFGEFGVMEGQFTEPSGVAVNAQSDIIVADTNNHRIQVFDKEGRFKFQFGECGKRDGQLLYPNRVAVNRVTGDFIVTERSPTHQIQIYNQYGQFIRKFGANILQHPRGVCVDNQGRIIVVECKVMRVLIFDAHGNEIRKFSCARYLEFPNAVCATNNNEILISDNRAHCVKVFSYEGQYLRQIGGEGTTNYPIGVGINSKGEVVIADNHNNFNLTVFTQEGTLLYALESKVKHAQCFDVALVDDGSSGSVILASKDYRLYLYRYQPLQQHQPCIGDASHFYPLFN